MKTKKCKNPECKKDFEITRDKRSNVYCSRSCSASHTNKLKPPVSDETKKKIKNALLKNKVKRIENISKATKGKYKKEIRSIQELSSKTVQKILKRLNLGCSYCGWDKTTCDIHHIFGRKIEDPNNHSNLTLLCPNCHRMAHENKLDKNKIITLNEYLPENWKNFYYG
jgi:predicted HNH restriction endonuclease